MSFKAYCQKQIDRRVGLLEHVQRDLIKRCDKLSAENQELRDRLQLIEQKDARPELRAVR